MVCATCSSEPVLLASSMAVLTAGADSSEPSVASNIFVGYISKKLLRRCPGVEAIITRCECGLSGEPHRLSACLTLIIRCPARLVMDVKLDLRGRHETTGSPPPAPSRALRRAS